MKTIEEGLNEAYKKAGQNAYFGEGFKLGVKFAQRWIPVCEELPPTDQPVTVKFKNFQGQEDYQSITFRTEERLNHYLNTHLKFTHWRPIEII